MSSHAYPRCYVCDRLDSSAVRASAGEPALCVECRPEVKVAEERPVYYENLLGEVIREFCPPVQPPKAAEEKFIQEEKYPWGKWPWIHYDHYPLIPFSISGTVAAPSASSPPYTVNAGQSR